MSDPQYQMNSWIVVHVGKNDLSKEQSELIKRISLLNGLFNALSKITDPGFY